MEIMNQQPPLGQHSSKSTAAAHRGEVFPAQPPRHARSNPRKMPFQTLVRIDGFVERRTCTRAMEKIMGEYGCDHPLDCENYMSMDWFKGKNTGEPHISWENRWFPLKILPSSNSLAQGKTL